jgi:hypothetical protein
VLAAIGRAYSRTQPGIGLDASAFLAETGGEDAPGLGLVFEALISARIDTAESPEERSKLERLRDSLTEVGESLLANILANVLTGQLPPL